MPPRYLALLCTLSCVVSVSVGCGKDKLDPFEEPATPEAVPGSIAGRVCDRNVGTWLAGVTATVTLADGTVVSSTTDDAGSFTLEGIPAGTYFVHFEGDGFSNDLSATVPEGGSVTIGPSDCRQPAGHLKGRVCNETTGLWVQGAVVTLDDSAQTSTTTDDYGRFQFLSLDAGEYVITIDGPGYTGTRTAQVFSGAVTDIGPEQCQGGDGGVAGRICGGDGYWLSEARVFIDLGGGAVVETTTDTAGYFTLQGVPAGTHTVQVSRGAFSTTFEVTVVAGEVTNLDEPVCIPPTTNMAVVTGLYDDVERVLGNLGFPVRDIYNNTTPSTQDPNGNVDIIKGTGTNFWVNDFLGDPLWMAKYDIIFFNCGLDDYYLTSGGAAASTALKDLQDFVSAGGSIYASDWASEVVRLAFPGRINYFGNDNIAGAARLGDTAAAQSAQVLDTGLAASLGRSTVTVNLNLPYWVVVDKHPSQAGDLRVLVEANVKYSGGNTLNTSPLVMQFTLGQGRVLYTSIHSEGQNTPDLQDILNYIIFEL